MHEPGDEVRAAARQPGCPRQLVGGERRGEGMVPERLSDLIAAQVHGARRCSDEHAAQAIQKFEGFELGGRNLRVNEATGERGGRPASGGFDRSFGRQDRPSFRPKPKGSRRNVRARKRSIW